MRSRAQPVPAIFLAIKGRTNAFVSGKTSFEFEAIENQFGKRIHVKKFVVAKEGRKS